LKPGAAEEKEESMFDAFNLPTDQENSVGKVDSKGDLAQRMARSVYGIRR